MKKTKLFALGMLAFAATAVFTSCSKDDDPEPTTPPSKTYYEYTARLLGGADNPSIGSFLTTQDSAGTVYFKAQADLVANQPKIDIIFYYGGTSGNNNTLASPSDTVFSDPNTASNPHPSVRTWGTRNATSFKATTASYSSVANDDMLAAAVDTNTSAAKTKVVQLAQGNVFTFINSHGKKGIMEIDSVYGTGGATRTIQLNIKVQK